MSDILAKIGKLALQAERAGTEAEAIAFAEKAQALATLSGIDVEVARRQQADKTQRQVPTQKRVVIGKKGTRALRTYAQLMVSIAQQNNVKINIGQKSDWVIMFGFESDIAVTEALYASLLTQMTSACQHYLASADFAAETVWSERTWDFVKVNRMTGRINFQLAFASTIGMRLMMARLDAEAQAGREHTEIVIDEVVTSTEMVLRDKQVEVADYYQAHSTARGAWKGGRDSSTHSGGARRAGHAAGRTARLGAEKSIGGSRAQVQA